MVWREQTSSPVANQDITAAGQWLILADEFGVGSALAQSLEAEGARCTTVLRGSAAGNAIGSPRIDPPSPAEFSQIVAEMRSTAGAPIRGIVYCWGIDAPETAALNPRTIAQSTNSVVADALYLLQALASFGDKTDSPKVWLVTRGAVATNHPNSAEHLPAIAQAPLWGFGRGLALEHPELFGGLIDLAPNGQINDAAGQILTELLADDAEDQVALRDGTRFVPRIVGRPASEHHHNTSLDPSGLYLITGGLGALGIHVARWLISKGAKHLLLTNRRGMDTPGAAEAVEKLKQLGAEVAVEPADISSETCVNRLFERIDKDNIPLRGIMHLAGRETVVPIVEMTADNLREVMAPKVNGSWLLHERSQGLELDFFVCFSSIASAWGSAGHCHYSAANAFLDALAHARKRLGLTALSVDWGPWKGGGIADEGRLKELERIGNRGLDPDSALSSMEDFTRDGTTQAIVADIDWPQYRAVLETRGPRPLFFEMDGGSERTEPATSDDDEFDWIDQLQGTLPEQRADVLTHLIRTEVANAFGFDDAEDVSTEDNFQDMGMGSLAAAELAKRLQASLGVAIATMVLFDQPCVDSLVQHLMGKLTLGENVVVSKYDPKLEEGIFQFMRTAFPKRDPDQIAPRWRWMFVESAKRLKVDPTIWLHQEDGTVLAHHGAFPIKLKIGDEERVTHWCVETRVLESHRSAATGTKLVLQCKQDLPFNLSLGQTDLMKSILLNVGWKQIGPLGFYLYPLRPLSLVQGKVPSLAALPAAAAINLATGVRRVRASHRHLGWQPEIRLIEQFGDEFDELWRSMSDEVDCAVVRDAAYLNWKYAQQPGQDFHCIEIRKEGRLSGLAVVKICEPDEFYSYPRAILIELVVRPSDEEAVWATLEAVRLHCMNAGAAAIFFYLTCPALHDQVVNFGFRSREPTRSLFICTDGMEQAAVQLLSSIDNWYLTAGDCDIDRPGQ